MFRLRLSTFLILLTPTYLMVLMIMALSIPNDYTGFNWVLLLWLILSMLFLSLFLILKEGEMSRLHISKHKNYIYLVWILYSLVVLACIFYKNRYRLHTLLDSLFWIIPLQWLIIGLTWSVIKKVDSASSTEDEREQVGAIPPEIYRDQGSFQAYSRNLIGLGEGFKVLLAAKKGINLPFLKSKEMELLLLEGQWRENERSFNRGRITSDTYSTTKTRLTDAIGDLLELT